MPTDRAASMTMHCRPRHSPRTATPVLAGELDGADLALDAADAEPAGDQHAVHVVEHGRRAGLGLAVVGRHPADLDLGLMLEPTGPQRLGDRQIGIGQVDVLADERDPHGLLRLVHAAQQVVPLGPVDVAERQVEAPHHVGVQLLAVQHLGNVVDRRCVGCRDHAVDVDVAHQRDLVLQRFWHVAVATQDQRVRRDADAAQCGDGVLRRLGLELARRREVRHQGDVQEEDVVTAHFVADLAGGLEEGQGFDVADGATDLGDHHVGAVSVGVRLRHRQDAALDLVGDVRDHLNGVTQVFTAPFLGDNRRIHLARGHIRPPGQVAVEEPLVVPDVEVGLGAVLGDEHLPVLERVHRPGVDVEVGIELLHRDLQPACRQQLSKAAGGQALAERRRNAATDEEVLGRGLRVLA